MNDDYCSEHNARKCDCIGQVPLFHNATASEVNMLSEAIHSAKLPKGAFVFREGEPSEALYILSRGVVRIAKTTEGGREQVLRFLYPGDFFGHYAALQNRQHYASAETVSNAVVCSLRKADFHRILERNPALTYRFLLAVAERLHQADEWMGSIAPMEIEQRLARILHDFYVRRVSGDDLVRLPMAKKDLASLLGTTPETLSRKLSLFRQKGLISTNGPGAIRILDPQRLFRLAGAE